jgi:hypothetical protein
MGCQLTIATRDDIIAVANNELSKVSGSNPMTINIPVMMDPIPIKNKTKVEKPNTNISIAKKIRPSTIKVSDKCEKI